MAVQAGILVPTPTPTHPPTSIGQVPDQTDGASTMLSKQAASTFTEQNTGYK